MLYDTCPTIEAWPCNEIHHMVISYDTSLTIDASTCHIVQSTVILYDTLPINDAWTCFITYARTCCMIHHLLSMEGDISYEMTNYS